MSSSFSSIMSTVVRNTIFVTLGQALPLLVGIAATPFVLRLLGEEQYGILSTVWVVLNYFSLFDLGLGRAITNFSARMIATGRNGLGRLIYNAVVFNLLIGLTIAVVWLTIADRLLGILKVSPAYVSTVHAMFRLLLLGIPAILVGKVFRGVLEAGQKFASVSAIVALSNASFFVVPLIGAKVGLTLEWILLGLIIGRIAECVAYMAITVKIYGLRSSFSVRGLDVSVLKKLLSFGGAVTLFTILSMSQLSADRFLIGVLISVADVSYYSVPYDVARRVLTVSWGLLSVLFPTISGLRECQPKPEIEAVFVRSTKYLLLIVMPAILVLYEMAYPILQIWVGEEIALHSAPVLRALSIGLLFGALNHTFLGVIQGFDRPDVIAKVQMIIVLPYLLVLTFLIKHLGVLGAAIGWTTRNISLFIVYSLATKSVARFSWRSLWSGPVLFAIASFLLTAGIVSQGLPLLGTVRAIVLCAVSITFYCVVLYLFFFDEFDRTGILSFIGGR